MQALIEESISSISSETSNFNLIKILISWDFYSDICDDQQSCVVYENILISRAISPPKRSQTSVEKKEEYLKINIEPLKSHYESTQDYIEHFLLLLILETKQLLYRLRETELKDDSGEIVNCLETKSVDENVFSLLIEKPYSKNSVNVGDIVLLYSDPPEEGHFSFISSFKGNKESQDIDLTIRPDNSRLASDIELLNIKPEDEVKNQQNLKFADFNVLSPRNDNPHHCLGIVDSFSFGLMTVRIIVRESCLEYSDFEEKLDSTQNGKKLKRMLKFAIRREKYRMSWLVDKLVDYKNNRWYFTKICDMNSTYREYQALMQFDKIYLRDHILGKIKDSTTTKFSIPDDLDRILKQNYNESQLTAIEECKKCEGLSFIQGPPGTGKTKLIIGILSTLLSAIPAKLDLSDSYYDTRNKNNIDIENTLTYTSKNCIDTRFYNWLDEDDIELDDLANEKPDIFNKKTNDFIYINYDNIQTKSKRILVCAPSNTAVDEIVRRLVREARFGGGIYNEKGELYNPSIVRMGRNFHEDLTNWSMYHKVNQKKQTEMIKSTDTVIQSFLHQSLIVCCTLSVAGHKDLVSFIEGFDTVIVDEASQCVETAILIPLKLKARRLILVGDPLQLSATVFSKIALEMKYDINLFQRLGFTGQKIIILSHQYRMHPLIGTFVSKTFYDNRLTNAGNILDLCQPLIPYYEIPIFKPFIFFNINSEEFEDSKNRYNEIEIDFCCQLVEVLDLMFNDSQSIKNNWFKKISIISPYTEQIRRLDRSIRALFKCENEKKNVIDINTVDGSQGKEKDIIIFSAVRSKIMSDNQKYTKFSTLESSKNDNHSVDQIKNINKTNIGFLAERRRLNVAITRAKSNLWIVGNADYLAGNLLWRKLIDYCKENDLIIDVGIDSVKSGIFVKRFVYNYYKENPNSFGKIQELCPNFIERIQRDINLIDNIEIKLT